MHPRVELFFEAATNTCVYVVDDGHHCAIIDSVMDFDPAAVRTSHKHADLVVEYVKKNNLTVQWILETHIHADHLTAAKYLKGLFPDAKVAMGERVKLVQEVFKGIFHYADGEFKADGHQFDHLFKDNEKFHIGKLEAHVIFTPGHTPACVCYHIGDAVFTGDTVFMPSLGTARCDFPHGSAEELFNSAMKIYALPDETRQFVGHIYGADAEPGKLNYSITIGEQKQKNQHIKPDTVKEEYVKVRQTRDATLTAPKLLLPSLQVNMRAGALPDAEADGFSYLKLPINKIPK